MNKNNYSSRQKGLFQLTSKEIIGYVMKAPLSITGCERDRDISALF